MNAFDLVVTVAIGSTLATVLLNKDVALAEGVLAFALLVGFQFGATWASVRVGWVRRLVNGEPALLLFRGEVLPFTLLKARVTEDEVRGAGLGAMADAEVVELETDGSFSVVGRGGSALEGVEVPPEDGKAR